jgi:hypothetical protein
MESASSFLTQEKVVPRVSTTVARTYLMNSPSSSGRTRPDLTANFASKVSTLQGEGTKSCLAAASAIERVLDQLGDCADRIVRSRSGGIAFIFVAGSRYAMLECDDDGVTVALLSDRSSNSEADTWVVDANGLTGAVRRIRTFLGAPHGAHP